MRPDSDDAAELVPLHGREGDARLELAAEDVQIGAAQPGVGGAHQDLVGANLRVGPGSEADVTLTVKDAGFHRATS